MIEHQLEFLKQIVSILMGLSITYTVQSFLEKYIQTKSGANFQQYSIFILLLFNIIRFYYGNWMYISKELRSSAFAPRPQRKFSPFLISFFIFIIQSVIFSMLSLQKYDNFFYFFASVLFVDALGFAILNSLKHSNDSNTRTDRIERMWTWNNTLAVVLLLVVFLLFKNSNNFFIYCFIISIINTVIGCYLNFKNFF